MGYAAVRGGEEAIAAAEMLERQARQEADLDVGRVGRGLAYAVDAAMAQAGLYAPALAAQAFVDAQGDTTDAAFRLRAYRSTLERVEDTRIQPDEMRLTRRICSAYKDVPGGQYLGATRDFTLRIVGEEHLRAAREAGPSTADGRRPDSMPRITALLRERGYVATDAHPGTIVTGDVDLTRQPLRFPADRRARLQLLARGETAAMESLAYSAILGFGALHPTLAELRVGHVPVRLEHPLTGETIEVGEVHATEVEAIHKRGEDGHRPALALGYGLTFGRTERKAIAMALLDITLSAGEARATGPAGPAEDTEFVLAHTDGVEASGMIEHLKLPHYVTFESTLDRIRGLAPPEAA
jgi:alpha-D-ribose 1-methylphosphonate 5-triphosphate synthase subunit PhnI